MKITIAPPQDSEPVTQYLVEQTFSNKWEHGKSQRCNTNTITDPMLEPMKVSGSFVKVQREAKYDMNGVRLVTSANEMLKGPELVFDYARPTVRIEQNVGSLGLSTMCGMVNTVNGYPIWGCPARCVKLETAGWERKVYYSCCFFYTRFFEFAVDLYNVDADGNQIGFDKLVDDAGSMCLAGKWCTDKSSSNYLNFVISASVSDTTTSNVLTLPQINFNRYKDMNNEPATVVLDGAGRPANAPYVRVSSDGSVVDSGTAWSPAKAVVQYYRESDFFELGIPAAF